MDTGCKTLHVPNTPSNMAVVLIHGLGSTYAKSFAKDGRDIAQAIAGRYDYSTHCEPHIVAFEYKSVLPGYGPSFTEIANQLACRLVDHAALSACHSIVLVGNSAGGIVIGELLRQSAAFPEAAARIKGVVTLGTPFSGVPGFARRVLAMVARIPGFNQARELLPGSRLLQGIAGYWKEHAWGGRHQLEQRHFVECEEWLPFNLRLATVDSVAAIGASPAQTNFVGRHHLELTKIRGRDRQLTELDSGPELDAVVWGILERLDRVGRPRRPYTPTIQERTLLAMRRGAMLDGRHRPGVRMFAAESRQEQAVETLRAMEPGGHRFIAATTKTCTGCGGGLTRAMYFQDLVDAAVDHFPELDVEPETAARLHMSHAAMYVNLGEIEKGADTLVKLKARGLVDRNDAEGEYKVQSMAAHANGTIADVAALADLARSAFGGNSSQTAEAMCCRICAGIRLGAAATDGWIADATAAALKVGDEVLRGRLLQKINRLELTHRAVGESRTTHTLSDTVAEQLGQYVTAAGSKNRQLAAWGSLWLHRKSGDDRYRRYMMHYVDELGAKRFDCALDLTEVFGTVPVGPLK